MWNFALDTARSVSYRRRRHPVISSAVEPCGSVEAVVMNTQLPSVVTVCGRRFNECDLDVVRAIIADEGKPCRAEIARRTCQALGWTDRAGRPKAMSCRVALLRLERHGLLRLPPPRNANGNRARYEPSRRLVEPCEGITGSVEDITGLLLRAVGSRSESQEWNDAIAHFHYLGFRPLPGAQQRYLIDSDRGLLGALGFGASAWKVAPRDSWIGWTPKQRRARLHLVVNNARFVLLPWVCVANLASRVLGMAARRIRDDWRIRYGYEPVLLETFVERPRFYGGCYRAANWVYVGDTKGRGKLDRHHDAALSVKRVFVLPLTASWREELSA